MRCRARIDLRRAEVVAPYGHGRTAIVGADDSVRPEAAVGSLVAKPHERDRPFYDEGLRPKGE